jgi:protoporphyrinogen oxidase
MYHQGKFYPSIDINGAASWPGLGDHSPFWHGVCTCAIQNWQALEKYTADAWMRKWAGRRAYELMWEPLLVGKFGERYARQVNMAWMWARLKSRTTRLGLKGGFQAFPIICRHLRPGWNPPLPVEQVERTLKGGATNPKGEERYAQALVTTCLRCWRIAPSLPPEYLRGLLIHEHGGGGDGPGAKTAALRAGYYWYNLPKSAGFPFLALVEHTNFLSPEYFGGDHLVYVGDYLETDHEYFQMSQEELLQRFAPSFTTINPRFSLDWIKKTWLFRTNYAQPIPLVNHSRNIPAIQTPLPGLFFASMSQVYPWDRGTNFAVEIGRRQPGVLN